MILRKRLALLLCLWTTISIGYFFWRSSSGVLVWCDSVYVSRNLFDEPKPLFWSDSGQWRSVFHYGFYDVAAAGYRPLSHAIGFAGTLFFSDPTTNPNIWFAAIGVLIGSLAVVVFLVSRRFLSSDSAALFAVLLFLFSSPVVTGAWNFLCGIQSIVPLFICLGLLLYWQTVEAPGYNNWYLGGLCAVLFAGPWLREFVGLLPILLIFLELRRARRPTLLMGTAGLFFVHALYPTAIMKVTFYPDLPLKPVFRMGTLGAQTGAAKDASFALVARLWTDIRWEMPLHFLSLYPPLLLLLVLIAFLLPAFRLIWPILTTRVRSIEAMRSIFQSVPQKKQLLFFSVFLLGVIGFWYLQWPYGWGFWPYGVGFWLCVGLALVAVGHNLFLGFWFLLFFIPFLYVFTEQVHLAYPLLPACIIVAAAVEGLAESIQKNKKPVPAVRWIFMSVLIIAISDQSLNPYSSWVVVHATNDGILRMGNWFRSHVPRGSIVVSNALHAEDIRLFSGNHFSPRWTVRAGIARNRDAVAEPEELAELLKRVNGRNDVYFLDVDFNYLPEKVNYHAHKYVRSESVPMENMGLIHTTKVVYPYVDPLKAIVSRAYVSFLGPADLENDFYHGPAQDGSLFFREVYAEYHVYRVTGTEVAPWDSNSPWTFVQEGYRAFNIFENRNHYVAFAQSLGAVDLHGLSTRRVSDFQARGGFAIGDSLEEVKRSVDQMVDKAERHAKTVTN